MSKLCEKNSCPIAPAGSPQYTGGRVHAAGGRARGGGLAHVWGKAWLEKTGPWVGQPNYRPTEGQSGASALQAGKLDSEKSFKGVVQN